MKNKKFTSLTFGSLLSIFLLASVFISPHAASASTLYEGSAMADEGGTYWQKIDGPSDPDWQYLACFHRGTDESMTVVQSFTQGVCISYNYSDGNVLDGYWVPHTGDWYDDTEQDISNEIWNGDYTIKLVDQHDEELGYYKLHRNGLNDWTSEYQSE